MTRYLLGSAMCAVGRYEEGLDRLDQAMRVLGRLCPGTTKMRVQTQFAIAEVMLQLGQTGRALKLAASGVDVLAPGGRCQAFAGSRGCRAGARAAQPRHARRFAATLGQREWLLADAGAGRTSAWLGCCGMCGAVRSGDGAVTAQW